MRERAVSRTLLVIGSMLAVLVPLSSPRADAAPAHENAISEVATTTVVGNGAARRTVYQLIDGPARRHSARRAGVSCVPFARRESGIDLTGNAYEWWRNAKGVYARGTVPQLGGVLAFRSNSRMRLGHVAVVTQLINAREIEVDQANWPRGAVERGVSVVDVSEWNDWSEVRVAIGHSAKFGSIYPTYGFIYDRPDNGRLLVSARLAAPAPTLNPVPSDLRALAHADEEVAEAPAGETRRPMARVRAPQGSQNLPSRQN